MKQHALPLLPSFDDYTRVEQALAFLGTHFRRQPTLEETAEAVGLSPYHFQRLFRRWAGISPKRFLQYVTAAYARQLLDESCALLDVAYASGLSSPSRLHDLFVAIEAVTPGEFKKGGGGLAMRYGFHPTPFGECLLSLTDNGVTGLAFVAPGERAEALAWQKQRWPGADFHEAPASTAGVVREIFGHRTEASGLRLLVRGTNLQVKVWEALLRVPEGRLISYGSLARWIGKPDACRAVASAVGANPVALLIPCHRVIRNTGAIGGYRWGIARKQALIGWEAAKRQNAERSPGPSPAGRLALP